MPRVIYNPRKGWFGVMDVLVGTFVRGTRMIIPDEHGCTMRRFVVGPFPTTREAIAAWTR